MKRILSSNVILIIVLFLGVALLLYPTISNYWNQQHQSKVIVDYRENVENTASRERQQVLQEAVLYNKGLVGRSTGHTLSETEWKEYESRLNIAGDGVMGYVEIPKLQISLPIYHGTSEEVLQTAIGHLEWTSLPVGGLGSHCVISGHRGLPSARLFTDLDQMKEGDQFVLKVLDEKLTYEVDQILIVEPADVEALKIVDEKDYCTLMTCTPYGVNTHRLLVRGHRVEVTETYIDYGAGDATQVSVVYMISVAVAVAFVIWLLVLGSTRKKRKEEKQGVEMD